MGVEGGRVSTEEGWVGEGEELVGVTGGRIGTTILISFQIKIVNISTLQFSQIVA